MPLLVPPQMLNTMDEHDLADDPVRRYMLQAHSERDPDGRAIRGPSATACTSGTCGPWRG